MSDDLPELLSELDMEFYAEREGLAHKMSSGQSGLQMNLRECPECNDDRWRTYVNAETGAGNCFVCGATFSKWSFLKAHTGLSNGDVFRHLREALHEQGWRPKRTVTAAVENPTEITLPRSIPLPYEGQNLIYLERRGFDAELVGYFRLRYCEDGWWNFRREDGSRGGQNFKGRVIIPVYDLNGDLRTFQGRDVTGAGDPKYLFPARLPATGRFLYNAHNVIKARRVVVGEGAFDVMALKQAVDGESELRDMVPVGTFGKHLSSGGGQDQLGAFLELRRRGVEEVTICWDGEVSALNAAAQAAELLSGHGLRSRVALLPKGADPNETPVDVLRHAIWQARQVTPSQIVKWRLRNPYA